MKEFKYEITAVLEEGNGSCHGCFFEYEDTCPCDVCSSRDIFVIKEIKDEENS